VPEEILKTLDVQLVSHADDVLPLALLASKEEIFSGECSDSLIHSLRSPRTFSKDLGTAVL